MKKKVSQMDEALVKKNATRSPGLVKSTFQVYVSKTT